MKYTFYCMVMEMYNDTQMSVQKKVFYNLVEIQKPIIASKFYYMGAIVLVIALVCLFFIICHQK